MKAAEEPPVFADGEHWYYWLDDVTFDGPFSSEEEAIEAWRTAQRT
jgi:hypothetical protein